MTLGWREQAKIPHSDQIVSMISLWKSRIKPADLCPGCSQGTVRPMTAASSCWLKWMSGKAEATRQSFNLSTTSPQIKKSRWTIPPGYNSSVNTYLALLSQPGCIIENREVFFFSKKKRCSDTRNVFCPGWLHFDSLVLTCSRNLWICLQVNMSHNAPIVSLI